ncbi:MAG: hypothetical protein DRI56_02040 [Chloroflexota bacterium]|nr:MAG: hypothetical protein DRI56_02040 [Chloroflexota bacterium]
MNDKFEEKLNHIRELEKELERELAAKSQLMKDNFKKQKMVFGKAIKEKHQKLKIPFFKYLARAKLRNVISAPIIYAMIIPLAFIDICVFIYQHTCFRLYKIPIVKRKEYFIIDRQYLSYLNILEKINCIYCGYGNAVAAYTKEVIGRTEQYWCPIKHASRVKDPHSRYYKFFEYGNAEDYRENLKAIKQDYT